MKKREKKEEKKRLSLQIILLNLRYSYVWSPLFCLNCLYINSQDARGQGAADLPAPPCMWIYRFGDKFSCRTMVSYPTPLNNVQ